VKKAVEAIAATVGIVEIAAAIAAAALKLRPKSSSKNSCPIVCIWTTRLTAS
jgi:hypothetical protein